MKVLVATGETQGRRDNDYCFAVEGELVCFPAIECSCEEVDGPCGCRRGMVGIASHRATTTVKVVDRDDLDPNTYADLIVDAYKIQGYVTDELQEDPEVREWLQQQVDDLVRAARLFTPGGVLERRGDILSLRSRVSNNRSR